jgi:anti-anti-sigma factor
MPASRWRQPEGPVIMEVSTHIDGKVAILSIDGRIDGTTVDGLEQAVSKVIAAGCAKLILDMRKVEYVSSAGLRGILLAAKKARTAGGGGVALFGLTPGVEEVMTMSGFASIIPIAATDADARLALGA